MYLHERMLNTAVCAIVFQKNERCLNKGSRFYFDYFIQPEMMEINKETIKKIKRISSCVQSK